MSTGLKACCASGSLHSGVPKGKTSIVNGYNTYIAEPEGGVDAAKGIVVVIPDIFGWEFLNNRVLADEYARKGGFLVFLPDFMDGYVVPFSLMASAHALEARGLVANIKKIYHILILLYWFMPFMLKNRATIVRPRVLDFFRGLKTSYPGLPVGAAGFCWGGKWTIELCHATHRTTPPVSEARPQMPGQSGGTGEPLVVCGYTAHPSMINYPGDIEAVELPLSIAAAGNKDPQMSRENGDLAKKILEGKNKREEEGMDGGEKYEFVWYDEAKHGFAVRADENDLEEAGRGRQAEEQAVSWFSRWFAASGKP